MEGLVHRQIQLDKNPLINRLRFAILFWCIVNAILFFVNQGAMFNSDHQQAPSAFPVAFTAATLMACLFTFVGWFQFNRWIRIFFGPLLVALGIYSMEQLVASIHFERDLITNKVCGEYGGEVKACVIFTVESIVLAILWILVAVEVWITFREQTAAIQMEKTKAEENREEIELESQRVKDVLQGYRDQLQAQAVLDEEK